jgi:hypothetical protein
VPIEQIEFLQNLAEKDGNKAAPVKMGLPRYLMALKIAKCDAKVIREKRKSRPNSPSRSYFCFFFSGS